MGLSLYLWARQPLIPFTSAYRTVLDIVGLRYLEATQLPMIEVWVHVAEWNSPDIDAWFAEAVPGEHGDRRYVDRETLRRLSDEAQAELSQQPCYRDPVVLRSTHEQLSRVLTLPSDVELYYQAVG